MSRSDKIIMGIISISPFLASATVNFISTNIWLLIFFIELSIAFSIITNQRIGPAGLCYLPIAFAGAIEIFRLYLSDWGNIDSQITLFALILAFVECMEFHKRYESEKHKRKILEDTIEELKKRTQEQ